MEATKSIAEIVSEAEKRGCPISQIAIEDEEKNLGLERAELWRRMARLWEIMHQSVAAGANSHLKSMSGLVGSESALMLKYAYRGLTLSGDGTSLAAARALGVSIVNASMGKIVAAPTAGSCGILPAVLLTVAEKVGADEDRIIGALFTAARIGSVIDDIASTSGAQGGCQAECGAASCMAAAAAVELAGGTPTQAAHAGALSLKSVIGLVCDPVAGLVEIPCVKRNAFGAVNALLAADMALAGIESKIPIDEVIEAVREVGSLMPDALKETGRGGLANTPTAKEIAKKMRPE